MAIPFAPRDVSTGRCRVMGASAAGNRGHVRRGRPYRAKGASNAARHRGRLWRKGLTLTELLVVATVSLVLAGALFLTFLASRNSYLSNEAYVQVQQQARRALDNMVTELRVAGGTITVVGNQLTFQLALGYNLGAPCPANDTCWGARDQAGANQGGWSVRYRLSGAQLVREVLDTGGPPPLVQATRVLANNVSQLSFTYVGGTTNTITMQLQAQQASPLQPGGTLGSGILSSSVRLRNS